MSNEQQPLIPPIPLTPKELEAQRKVIRDLVQKTLPQPPKSK